MRIIRLKLKKDVSTLLAEISREHGFDDPGFAEDIFSLMRLKGHGLPTRDRVKAMSEQAAKKAKMPALHVYLIMGKRAMTLKKFVGLAYFKALCYEDDLVLSVRRLLNTFNTLYRRARQAQCLSCNLRPQCQFGQQYGETMSDITKVLDPDYKIKVNDQCPFMPEIDSMNQLEAAAQYFAQMAQQGMSPFIQVAAKGVQGKDLKQVLAEQQKADNDPDAEMDDSEEDIDPDSWEDNYLPFTGRASAGKTNRYANRHTGQHICKVTEAFVNQVTNGQLAIYELGRKFSLALNASKRANFKPVPEVERSQKADQIKSEADIPKLISSQHGLPEQVFESRLRKKELIKAEYQKPDEKKQLLYLLLDSSGSMGMQLGTNSQYGLFTCGALAQVFSLALVRKVRQDRGIIHCRFFEGAPGVLYKADRDEEFDAVYQAISRNNFSGGGTNIPLALRTACDDIHQAEATNPLARAEILLITDCADSVNTQNIKSMLGKIELDTLDVSGGPGNAPANKELKAASNRYYKANESAPDVNSMVNLI
jgi:hypothetical protein